mmetsp:Transcript_58169/g.162164  ORF Transcript_58169/g.162164 Transcript_58169/m.162164 type:complete len:256 (+) Transcript_58169:2577-3344(+)
MEPAEGDVGDGFLTQADDRGGDRIVRALTRSPNRIDGLSVAIPQLPVSLSVVLIHAHEQADVRRGEIVTDAVAIAEERALEIGLDANKVAERRFRSRHHYGWRRRRLHGRIEFHADALDVSPRGVLYRVRESDPAHADTPERPLEEMDARVIGIVGANSVVPEHRRRRSAGVFGLPFRLIGVLTHSHERAYVRGCEHVARAVAVLKVRACKNGLCVEVRALPERNRCWRRCRCGRVRRVRARIGADQVRVTAACP